MARHSGDVWGHVQRQLLDHSANVRLVPMPQRTVQVTEPDLEWHTQRFGRRAEELFQAWEQALVAGRSRRAARLRSAWMHTAHLDRIAYAREVAEERGLRLDAMGRGPLVDRATVHYRDRLPWVLTPAGRYDTETLPDRAASVIETWNGSGWVFDSFYVADEPVSSGHFPVHSLIGAVSPDGRTADWFILDRWAS
jgi:hypothetical protein